MPIFTLPAGSVWLSASIAAAIAATERPWAESFAGSSRTFTWRSRPPNASAVPTPGTRLRTSTMSSFTVSSSFSMFSVAVTEKPRIGMLAVLNLNITGSSASSGRRRLARSRRSRMSFAASPSSVPHLNLQVTRETPSLVVEVISSRSVTEPSALSMTRVICCSTSSVEAPSQRVKTEIDGLSISGIMSIARRCHAMTPRRNTATNAMSVATGRLTPVSESFMARYSTTRTAAPSARRWRPSTTISSPSDRPETISTTSSWRSPASTSDRTALPPCTL